MICPNCKEKGLKSKVYIDNSESTLLRYAPFYDEEGEYHSHSKHIITSDFSCSNGHRWSKKREDFFCPSCDGFINLVERPYKEGICVENQS